MKFTGALSTLLVVLPFFVLQVSAAPSPRGGRGGNRGGNNRNGAAGAAGAAGAGAAAGAVAGQPSTINGSTATNATSANNGANNANNGANNANNANNATGTNNGGAANEQSSLTLDPSVIGNNIAQNGLNSNGTEAGQVASLTSVDNFINFCVGKSITNGLQIQGGSCNPIPMGDIPNKSTQPACKFQSPPNMGNVAANTAFTVTMAIQGMETGNFVNPDTNYFGAPQQLNPTTGQIIGHSHVVIQSMPSITSTTPLDPNTFAFFLGLNAPAANGVLTADVSKGLPAGTYRLFSINTAANHQPVIGPVAQHGSFDDAIYFTVGNAAAQAAAQAVAGGAAANNTANAGAGAANNAGAGAANNGTANAGNANAGAGNANAGAGNANAGAGNANAGAGNANAGAGKANNAGAAGKNNAGAAGKGNNAGTANKAPAPIVAGAGAAAAKPANQAGSAAVKGTPAQGKRRRSFTISRQD